MVMYDDLEPANFIESPKYPKRTRRVAIIDTEGNVISEDYPLPVDQIDLSGNSTGYEQPEQTGLLQEILKQLKITNLHLSILTDNQINNTEVE